MILFYYASADETNSTMILFGIQFIFARDLCGGRTVGEWQNIEKWIHDCEETESWQRAVKRTGHEM
jgi:glutathione S-transferase